MVKFILLIKAFHPISLYKGHIISLVYYTLLQVKLKDLFLMRYFTKEMKVKAWSKRIA